MPSISATIDSSGAVAGAATFDKAVSQIVKGAEKVESTLGSRVSGAMSAVGRSVATLQGALAGLGVAFGIKSVISASDEFSTMRARLEAVTGSAAGAQAAMADLAAAAERARTPATEIATQYLRIQNAMTTLKRPTSDAVAVTELLAKAVKISGISAGEASAAMMQLSQAIASGRFQGDEFRSVAENMPIVMRILQEQTGKTAGQLRALASDGKLTADILVKALLNATGQINAQFVKMPQTAGDAFTVLRDQLSRTTGAIAESSGVSREWSRLAMEMRNVVSSDTFKGGLKSVADGVAGLGGTLADTIPTLRQFIAALQSDLASATGSAESSTFSLSNLLHYVWVGSGAQNVMAGVIALGDKLGPWFSAKVEQGAKSINGSLLTGLQAVAAEAQKLGGLSSVGSFGASKAWTDATTVNKIEEITFAENQRVTVLRLQNELISAQIARNETRAMQVKTQIQLESTVTDQLKKDDPVLAGKLTKLIQINGALERQKALADLSKVVDDMRAENMLLEAQAQTDENITRAVEAQLAIRKLVTPEVRSLSPALADLLEHEVLITKELERQKEKAREAYDQGKQFGDAIGNAMQGLVLGGKSWNDTLKDVLTSFANILFKLTVMEPLAKSIAQSFQSFGGIGGIGDFFGSFLGGGGSAGAGGWTTTVMPGFADGGIFKSPIALSAPGFTGVMAERGPEAVMPLARTPGGDLGVRILGAASGGDGGAVSVAPVFNFSFAGGSPTGAEMSALREAVANVPQLIRDVVRREVLANPAFLRR